MKIWSLVRGFIFRTSASRVKGVPDAWKLFLADLDSVGLPCSRVLVSRVALVVSVS